MGKEQREFKRAELRMPVQYHLAGGFTSLWQQGFLLNLSAAGLRLASRATNGEPGLLGAFSPTFDGSGQRLAFASASDNL